MTDSVERKNSCAIIAAVIGSTDFCRRMQTLIRSMPNCLAVFSGRLSDTWSLVISHRPNLLIFEIGFHHDRTAQDRVRALLEQTRTRFKEEIYTTLVGTSAETFSYIGDLLFPAKESGSSGLVDALLFAPPGKISGAPLLSEQIGSLLPLIAAELKNRSCGKIPLPPLNDDEWIQSQADPSSRDVWMRWIPRYASYVNESPLIIGETGSGKTKIAFALHKLSGRRGKFVSITPRDFSSSELVQAELFGAVAGAYTGALDKWGLVKSAEKGTLFIDELQSIDKDLQGKLITFIEDKVYRRVGSAESVEADVRFVFASNKSIEEMIEANILREDFAYRLERVQLKVAALRERRLDISAALAYALGKIHRQRPNASTVTGFTSDAYRMLFCHRWPGNLRQLENIVAQLCDVAEIEGRALINEADVVKVLGDKITLNSVTASEIIAAAAAEIFKEAMLNRIATLDESIAKFRERIRLAALDACHGDPEKAADLITDNKKLVTFTVENYISKKETGASHG